MLSVFSKQFDWEVYLQVCVLCARCTKVYKTAVRVLPFPFFSIIVVNMYKKDLKCLRFRVDSSLVLDCNVKKPTTY